MVLGDLALDLNVELDEAVHGDRDGDGVEAQHPNVAKGRAQRGVAVAAEQLGDERHEREEHADEAVLEDADPDDLHSQFSQTTQGRLTLNQVRPLRGIRKGPLSFPPVHFWNQLMGMTQFTGLRPRK